MKWRKTLEIQLVEKFRFEEAIQKFISSVSREKKQPNDYKFSSVLMQERAGSSKISLFVTFAK